MHEIWFSVVWALGAYLVGSLPIGDLVGRAVGVNIRTLGTGNPGAANIYREVGRAYGITVFALDVAKGVAVTVPLFLIDASPWAGPVAVAGVLSGHFFPIFLRFRGGTGMAVEMGVAAGLLPLGVFVASPLAVLLVSLSHNVGYSGTFFLVTTLLAGGLLHRDLAGVAVVACGAVAILIRSWLQYRRR